MTATDPFVDMTFRVPASLLEQMRAYAREHDTTITAWVQDAIHSKLAAVVAERADSPPTDKWAADSNTVVGPDDQIIECFTDRYPDTLADPDLAKRVADALNRQQRVRVVAIDPEADRA